MDEPVLAVDNIQGNIIPGFNKPYQAFLFLKIRHVPDCKRWLDTMRHQVTPARDILRNAGAPVWINIAFSYNGIKRLRGVATNFLDTSFKLGLAAQSKHLGDPIDPKSAGHPRNWKVGGPGTEADILLLIAGDARGEDEFKHKVQPIEGDFRGVSVLFRQPGARLPDGREHFGFRGSVSQPGLRGRLANGGPLTPGGKPEDGGLGEPNQDLLWPGEFVFGYPRQNPESTTDQGEEAREEPYWTKHGSFLVFRRLRQDVYQFHRFIHDTATELRIDNLGLVAAMLVGRWPDGAPLMRANDPRGTTCPFASHVRKTNPCDDEFVVRGRLLNGEGLKRSTTQTHRLLRRGIPYGPRSQSTFENPRDDGEDRGLLFLAYQTSIERQFEWVTWNCNDPDFKERGAGYDLIIGQNNRPGEDRRRSFAITWQGADKALRSAVLSTKAEWVVPTGGGYFFAPSLEALQKLATGEL
ncbi:MAG: Dyp-type peroxidase [Thermodesulfobacteriota bacterium]